MDKISELSMQYGFLARAALRKLFNQYPYLIVNKAEIFIKAIGWIKDFIENHAGECIEEPIEMICYRFLCKYFVANDYSEDMDIDYSNNR